MPAAVSKPTDGMRRCPPALPPPSTDAPLGWPTRLGAAALVEGSVIGAVAVHDKLRPQAGEVVASSRSCHGGGQRRGVVDAVADHRGPR